GRFGALSGPPVARTGLPDAVSAHPLIVPVIKKGPSTTLGPFVVPCYREAQPMPDNPVQWLIIAAGAALLFYGLRNTWGSRGNRGTHEGGRRRDSDGDVGGDGDGGSDGDGD